jgi:hypothetical protein
MKMLIISFVLEHQTTNHKAQVQALSNINILKTYIKVMIT